MPILMNLQCLAEMSWARCQGTCHCCWREFRLVRPMGMCTAFPHAERGPDEGVSQYDEGQYFLAFSILVSFIRSLYQLAYSLVADAVDVHSWPESIKWMNCVFTVSTKNADAVVCTVS